MVDKIKMLDFLLEDEKEAVAGYQKVIGELAPTDNAISSLTFILNEELHHIDILNELKEHLGNQDYKIKFKVEEDFKENVIESDNVKDLMK